MVIGIVHCLYDAIFGSDWRKQEIVELLSKTIDELWCRYPDFGRRVRRCDATDAMFCDLTEHRPYGSDSA